MSKRKITDEENTNVNAFVYNHLVQHGLADLATSFEKVAKVKKTSAPDNTEVYKFFGSQKGNAAKKAKVEKSSSSSSESDSDSSSDSESEDEKPAAKSVPVVSKKVESDSSDSDSSSSSDSEDEAPAKPMAAKPAAKPVAKKAAKSDSESDSDSSSSESEDEKPVVKTPVKSTPAKVAETPASTRSTNGQEFKVFVTGLPWVASEQEVKDFFESAGQVLSAELPLAENGKSSGTAYVKFGSREELDAALALDGQLWPGTERWLKIREGIDKPERRSFGNEPGVKPEGCDTVFVGNLPYEVDEQQMREVFEQCGEISSVRFASNEDGSFRGFGHVSFYNPDDVDKAIKMAGTMIGTRAIRVDYAPPRRDGGKTGGGRGTPTGRGAGRGGFGGRGGGRGGRSPANAFANKNKGSIVAGQGKKMSFDE